MWSTFTFFTCTPTLACLSWLPLPGQWEVGSHGGSDGRSPSDQLTNSDSDVVLPVSLWRNTWSAPLPGFYPVCLVLLSAESVLHPGYRWVTRHGSCARPFWSGGCLFAFSWVVLGRPSPSSRWTPTDQCFLPLLVLSALYLRKRRPVQFTEMDSCTVF